MDISAVKEWLIPISVSIGLISTSISSWLALRQYRLNLQAEERLRTSAQAEVDINLLRAFSELMGFAHARVGSLLSEKVVEEPFKRDIFTKEDLANLDQLSAKLNQVATVNLPVGKAQQDAAIAAVATLANRHEVLKGPGKQALETMEGFKPGIARKYLAKIV